MGSYLNFQLEDVSHAEEANNWLEDQPEQQRLHELRDRVVWFWTEADRQIEREKEKGVPDFYDIGEGQLKVSGLGIDNADEIKRLWASLFEKLHNRYDVKVLGSSCGLSPDYFSSVQIWKLTDGGDALSGDVKEEVGKILARVRSLDEDIPDSSACCPNCLSVGSFNLNITGWQEKAEFEISEDGKVSVAQAGAVHVEEHDSSHLDCRNCGTVVGEDDLVRAGDLPDV